MFSLFDEMEKKDETEEKKGGEIDIEKLANDVAEKVLKKLSTTEEPKKPNEPNEPDKPKEPDNE